METAMKDLLGDMRLPAWSKVRARYHGTVVHRDLQPLPMRSRHGIQPPVTLRSQMADAVSNPDFVAVTIFCAIGFLATVNLILRLPDIGVM
jgi:hypothetical protein